MMVGRLDDQVVAGGSSWPARVEFGGQLAEVRGDLQLRVGLQRERLPDGDETGPSLLMRRLDDSGRRTVNPLFLLSCYNFFYGYSRPALRAAACGGRPRPADQTAGGGVACDPAPAPVACADDDIGRSMPSFIKNLTLDCEDALRVARFWAAALVSDVDEESTAERAYVEAPGWGGPNIWFRGSRGPKTAPNRLHLDLRALTSMSEEVDRLITLGATVVQRYDDITVMQDPEGNEFCVEPGPADPHEASGR